jgi:hypothetical protein
MVRSGSGHGEDAYRAIVELVGGEKDGDRAVVAARGADDGDDMSGAVMA